MARAQGALEYLVIIATSIAILAVIVMISTNYFTANTTDYLYNSCREAASRCKMAISGNPADQCVFCNNACNLTNSSEIFTGAVSCCKLGRTSEIYQKSSGCQ
jgi:hypothetical protein